jgi:thiosulfate dehydrogenase
MEVPVRRAATIWTAVGSLALALACGREESPTPPADESAASDQVEVELCDGETTTTVPSRASYSHEEGLVIADELMAQWKRKNPDRDWVEVERGKHKIEPPADNSELIGRTQGDTYSRITEQSVKEWERETLKLVVRGSQIFHSADELGSQIAVSCDMCHPDAANTHPETYPKFQVQLGRAVLLRDMINWCIEHPVRGKVLAADSAEMRALEAYILAQRKGTALVYGKH